MTNILGAERLRNNLVDWVNSVANPNALPEAGAVGSIDFRNGNGSTLPTEIYYALNSTPGSSWVKQNVINLDIFNIRDFGAVGDGVTDDTVAIFAAITACDIAGGGIVYIPPGSWRVGTRLTALASFDMVDMHDITIMGDGFASKILMIGDAGASDWYLFYMHDGTSHIVFDNFYVDGAGITNPDPGEQTHLFFIASENADTNGGSHNIDMVEIYAGTIDGDVFRFLGSLTGGPIFDNRVEDCTVLATNCRSEVAVQRYTFRNMVLDCFLTGSNDQDIDFEPTGGAAPNNTGEDWVIQGNQIDHSSQNITCITLNGNGAASPTTRSIFAYQIMHNGSVMEMRDANRWLVHGNILLYTAALGGDIGISMTDGVQQDEITANIFDRPNRIGQLYRAIYVQAGSSLRQHLILNNNVGRTFGDAGGGIAMGAEDGTSDFLMQGNLLTHVNATAGVSNGYRANATTQAVDGTQIIGNMIIATGAALLAGVQVSTSGAVTMGNFLVYGNWVRNSQAAVRLLAGSGGSFVDWREANDNMGVALTTSIVANAGGFTNGVTIEGNAGPSARFVQTAASPVGAVPSVSGSVALNTAGAEGTTLFYKETAASAVDTAGWISTGPGDLEFATQSVGAATTALFFASGMDLPVAVATEIQEPIIRPGTIREMRLQCVAGVGGGNNTFTARKNGANTALTFTISNTASAGSVAPTGVTTVAGDLWSVQVTKTAAPATPQTFATITLEMTG